MKNQKDASGETSGTEAAEGLKSPTGALAYQGALEAVFSILIGAGLGAWADHGFGTSPIFLLVGLVIGFAAFVLRIVRLGRRLHETANETSNVTENATSKGPDGGDSGSG